VDTIVFDKTGTLSQVQPRLVDFRSLAGISRPALQASIASVQVEFQHPIASLFTDWEAGSTPVDRKTIPGTGVEATLSNSDHIRIGNERLLKPEDQSVLLELMQQPGGNMDGCNQVYVKVNHQLVGVAFYRETLRAETHEVIQKLQAAGYDLHLFTGDQAEKVELLSLHSLSVAAGLSPLEKKERVMALESAGARVLFVGDGTNDAPALDAAHASLALNQGNAVATESAQASINTVGLSPLLPALNLSRRTMQTLKSNLIFASAYNLIGISLAATGILNPIWAALLMLVSSATVSTRALRSAQASLNSDLQSIAAVEQEIPDTKTRRSTWIIASGILVAALLFAYAGNFPLSGWIICLACAGVAIWMLLAGLLHLKDVQQEFVLTGIWGIAGMFAGWIILAGWKPVVHQGVCLCGCANSPFGVGLTTLFNPMYIGMILASLAAWTFTRADFHWHDIKKNIVCMFAMCAGMGLATQFWSLVPVLADAHIQYLLTAGVMTGSMLAAMAACLWISQRHASLAATQLASSIR
jgi:magnesium-transporting ATPase (P-type)